MKQVCLLLLALSYCYLSPAQLKADAGPDKAWCSGSGPHLGGTMPASGGLPPYTYTWQTIGITTHAYFFLDTFMAAHPKTVIRGSSPKLDSVFFQLRVTDSLGAVADDTVLVYFFRTLCCMGDYPIPKRVDDTVKLKPISCCSSNFEPRKFLHWDTSAYLSDSTDPYARCWCPTNYFFYPATFIDRIGCPVGGGVVIYINPNAIAHQPAGVTEIAIVPNPVTSLSELRCSAAWIGSKVMLTTSEGREVGSFFIRSAKTPLAAMVPKAAGIYQYRVVSQSGKVFNGKLVRQ